MGLDQYLYAERYLGRWDHSSAEERMAANAALLAAGLSDLQEENAGVMVRATIGYWRKANQIHNWFVDNVQGGEDDCGTYDVSKEDLEELKQKCVLVLAASEMVDDNVVVGHVAKGVDPVTVIAETIIEGSTRRWEAMLERGQVILNPEVAEAELPSREGFLFGSTDYDQFYIQDLIRTVDIANKALTAEGFDFYYASSW